MFCENRNCPYYPYYIQRLQEQAPLSQGTKAKIVKRKMQKPGIDITYPEVQSLKNKRAQERINDLILRNVRKLTRDSLDTWEEAGGKVTITGDYRVTVNRYGVLSLYFEQLSYVQGAAHPMTLRRSLTMDLDTGRPYAFRDLFKRNAPYQRRIDAIIRREIKERDLPLIAEFTGVTEDQPYYLTPNTLVVYFPIYEFTPYVVGIPEFPIPFGMIEDIISDRGPIAKLI